MNLNQTILDAARDEVCRNEEWGKGGYEESMIDAACNHPEKLQARMYVIENKAALLAMEKQAEFMRAISKEGWVFLSGDWYQPHTDMVKTELELYEIWEGRNHE